MHDNHCSLIIRLVNNDEEDMSLNELIHVYIGAKKVIIWVAGLSNSSKIESHTEIHVLQSCEDV